ncbi:plasmid stabilization system [Desulfonatronospira thiodismutans ASO3-1]|uniref:Plasmid stabilization system n=1 Tax=Desulfonatronospira thiodismutans ASO3-1 TaxID=555779 RepID=D6SKQ5_9BACT|nr:MULTISPECIES: type II toxin-antitoxin system RelE/ParE family toxin [Desulfonatronospira]EFI35266.1 plasmid stabilization system [Desulfonatronospira thiodismutans ASO3-1]RQD79647.1 MAG: plasmid stabilization protein [Desulfonatronospira sp. MSAO_Bac3]
MTWTVIYHQDVEEDLLSLGPAMAGRVVRAIDSKLTRAPLDFGLPLSGNLTDFRKLSVGDCRVVSRVFQEQVYVLAVGPRRDKEIYRMAGTRKRE